MKKVIGILFLFTLTAATFLQAQDNNDVKDPKAKAILEELSKKNKSYSTIQADFEYTLENKDEGINETQTGDLTLKGNKYILNIAGQKVISDGATVWTFIEEVNEVQVNNVPTEEEEEAAGSLSPNKIFSIYEEGFKYVFDKETEQDGKTLQIINLFPEDPAEKPYHTVKLFIDKEKNQMTEVKVFSKDGNIYSYNLKEFKTNEPIEDSAFKFDVSTADEVIDLRE